MQKINEPFEALMRIVVGIVSGFILNLWKILVSALAIVNFFIVLFTGKRNKDLADFCEVWNSQLYVFLKYMTFVSNERPFPFANLSKSISKFEN